MLIARSYKFLLIFIFGILLTSNATEAVAMEYPGT